MIIISDFIKSFSHSFADHTKLLPWEITQQLNVILYQQIAKLGEDFHLNEGVAIHKSSTIETGVILKAPVIISADCFVASNAYLRGGVYLGKAVKIGTGCEIKTSLIFSNSTIAHFNFIGDCIIGSDVNFEAGAVTANHFNEREDKNIWIHYQSILMDTQVVKFGSLVGDHSKIGANAVLSPGTILPQGSIVKRLELIDQVNSTA